MNIVYSSSDLYSELASVSIVSILENSNDAEEINIYVIDKSISEKHKQEMLEMVNRYNRKLTFLPDIDVEGIANTKIEVFKWHISTFSRLFLLHVLPSTMDKVIYVDCDMIIRHSLVPLWDMDMENAWVMSADDCRGERYRDDIGIDRKSIYTNNGLMVIDLKAWRENNIEEKFIAFIKKYNGNITYVDQGVLNGVLQPLHKIKLLPIEYNAQSACYYLGYDGLDLCRKPVWAYAKEDFNNGISDPVIVHFTSCFYAGSRPWEKKDNHPYRQEFLKYRTLTPWKDSELWDNTEPKMKKLQYKICQTLPKGLTFRVVRVLHSWAYPISRMLRRK